MILALVALATAHATDLPFHVVQADAANSTDHVATYEYELVFSETDPNIADLNLLFDELCYASRVWVEWSWDWHVTAVGTDLSASAAVDTEVRHVRPGTSINRLRYSASDSIAVTDGTIPAHTVVHEYELSRTCGPQAGDKMVITIDGNVVASDPNTSGSISVVPFPLEGTTINAPILHIEAP